MRIKSVTPPCLPLHAGEEKKRAKEGTTIDPAASRATQWWMSAVCAPHHPAAAKLQGMGDLRAGLR